MRFMVSFSTVVVVWAASAFARVLMEALYKAGVRFERRCGRLACEKAVLDIAVLLIYVRVWFRKGGLFVFRVP